jgi:hypothetical protein
MLSAIPLEEGKSHPEVYFARLPSIDLNTCVSFIERSKRVGDGERDQELEQLLQKQHGRDFKDGVGTKPFWRLTILHDPSNLQTFTAVWIFHHALADGSSALVFHKTLLSALRDSPLGTAEAPSPIVKSPEKQLLPPLEELHPLPISITYILKALLGLWFPAYFKPRPAKLWTGGPVSNATDHLSPKLRSLVLSSSSTKKLLDLSRANNTTMTGTLESLMASAILSNLDPQKYDEVKVDGPISMRRFMKWDGGSLEDELVSGMTEYAYIHTRDPQIPAGASSFSWDDARGVRAAIQKELDKKGRDSVVGLLKYVSDMQGFFTEHIGKERGDSFEMSNIGAWKENMGSGVGKETEWKIGRCTFSQNPNVSGAAMATSVVTGGDGCAVLVFTWYEGIVEEGLMARVVGSLEGEVGKLVGGSA